MDPQNPGPWIGRRVLNDSEIDQLARGIVKEIRKRGPFISLADFINRRVGNDNSLARAGAIQSALDSTEVQINSAYQSGDRAVGAAATRFTFPKAEEGPLSYGSPGIVKQADILTPIAPILSARSDSFLIRGYGEKTDGTGKVIARAWCEAVIQRSPEFIDPADLPEKTYSTISKTPLIINPGESSKARPTGAVDDAYYDIAFATREPQGDKLISSSRWPIDKNLRSYVFFFTSAQGKTSFRAVDEYMEVAAP